MAGGYAIAGRGPRWARWAAGAFALLPAWLVGMWLAGGSLAPYTTRGAWVAVLFLSLVAVLAIGCALPHDDPAAVQGRG